MTLGEYKSRLASGQRTFTPMNGPQDQEIKDVINKTLSTPSKPTTSASTTTSSTPAKPVFNTVPTPGGSTTSAKPASPPSFSGGASLKDIMAYRMKTNPPSGLNSSGSSSGTTNNTSSGVGSAPSTKSTTSTTSQMSTSGLGKLCEK